MPRTSGAARVPETDSASRASPCPRKRRVERRQHAQVGAPARFDRERAVAERVERAAHPQVGALARQAERAEVEPPVRELQRARPREPAPGSRAVSSSSSDSTASAAELRGPRERPRDARPRPRRRVRLLGQARLDHAQEGVDAGRARHEREVRGVGRRREHRARQGEVDAGRAAAAVERHAAVAVAREAGRERADALVPIEEVGRLERAHDARARERPLQRPSARRRAARDGRAGLERRGDLDVLHLRAAVVDAVVGDAAREVDAASADARAPRVTSARRPFQRDSRRASS